MKYLMLFLIKLYWFLIPAHKRNKCLFKESFSTIVFRIAKGKGFWNAIKVFKKRKNMCVPNYEILAGGNFSGICIKDSIKIPYQNLSITVQAEINFYKSCIVKL